MKAIHAYNARGTVHEWAPTAVYPYLQRKCDKRQVNRFHLQASEADIKDMPACKRCFPAGKTEGNK